MSTTNRLAPTPPMGWNTYDCFGGQATEAEVCANAVRVANILKPFGYEYVVIDGGWYHPSSAGANAYSPQPPSIDKFGRYWPAMNRFPSARGGKGFKPLADFVHSLGLKFGIHIMRGIPQDVVRRNLPLHGQKLRARDIANTTSVCAWSPQMFGVDMTRKAGWKYYKDLVTLYASWDVDFIKADDMISPYWEREVEALHAAMQKCGREMLLSLSPGTDSNTMMIKHSVEHSEMFRVSRDVWDRWVDLKQLFGRAWDWTPCIGPGHWPDLDMLPLGRVSVGNRCVGKERMTSFSRDEQRMTMSLWCIFRSPLMMGGDLRKLDKWTLDLITNPEVLEVNQASMNNREIMRIGEIIVWAADKPRSKERWIAAFNAGEKSGRIDIPLSLLGLSGKVRLRDVWTHKDAGVAKNNLSVSVARHAVKMYRLSPGG
jgi:alpha-galactosidase